MQAMLISAYGAPEQLQLTELPDPKPGPGQVLIKVESASVNFADLRRRRNDPYPVPTPLPAVLGGEVAGTIVSVGEGVIALPIGARVFALTPHGGLGGYAQYAIVAAASVIPIPDALSFDIACTLVVAGVTAYQTLKEAGRLQPGESVFIPGAAGGVGAYAVQLAKLFGAGAVIAGASTAEKRDHALRHGADHVIDYTRDDWPGQVKALTGGRGADVVLDMAGGPFFNRCMEALAPFGRLVVYGTASLQPSSMVPQSLLGPCQSVVGYYVGAWFAAHPVASIAAFHNLAGYIVGGKIKVAIDARLPLASAADAHRMLENRTARGKIILKPWRED